MNSVKNRKFMYLICVLILTSAILTYATKIDNPAESGETKIQVPMGRLGRPPSRSEIAYRNRIAEEKYEQRNTEITPWVEDGELPYPNNAALMYYQALILFPEPNLAASAKFNEVYADAEPDRQVKIYLSKCLPAIELAGIASKMPGCIWGIWPERRLSGVLLSKFHHLEEILFLDAVILAGEGHYQVALERCLTLYRLARQLNEDPKLFLLSHGCSASAMTAAREVLGVMPPDEETLIWFKGRFAIIQGVPSPFAKELQEYIKSLLRDIRKDPIRLAKLRNLLVEIAEDEQAKKNNSNLTDEQVFLRVSKELQRIVDPIFRILDSEMTYEKKRVEMQRVVSKLTGEDATEPLAKAVLKLYLMDLGAKIDHRYPAYVGHKAQINSVKAAIEIYLLLAKTGKLPEKLPVGLPKDPYSGEDFEYKITDDGFVLQCQEKDVYKRLSKFEFKIKNK